MPTWMVGIDVGSKSAHTAQVLDDEQRPVRKTKFSHAITELEKFLNTMVSQAPQGTEFRFVLEPSGGVSKMLAYYLVDQGHAVFWAGAEQVKAMRAALGDKRRKTDRTDALALAHLGAHPEHLNRVVRPTGAHWEALRRGVKLEHKLAMLLGNVTKALKAAVDEAVPGLPAVLSDLDSPLTKAVYLHWTHASRLARQTPEALAEALERQSGKKVSLGLARELVQLGQQAVALGWIPAAPASGLDTVISTEWKLLQTIRDALERVQERNYALYRLLDPDGSVESLPGVGRVAAPAFLALAPLVQVLVHSRQLRDYSGWVPRVEASGLRKRHGRMSKAGPSWLKRILFLAADRARHSDPQLAFIYYRAMVMKGAPHAKAVCEVGVHLLDRIFTVLKEHRSYVLRNLEGQPITAARARALAQQWKVPEEVRQRQRRRNAAA
ncbi:transposase [Carboxydochorda subterranea]|uniref:Transposase n=1 Tax=Carboxydichorda subterranea TaxID=3109565 RepID=A0ABZ1BXE7_9FIRM|nr:transposase [Limnochorda sp. L945t]WRP17295.1 transposase [Limnochorda sp. L945t]